MAGGFDAGRQIVADKNPLLSPLMNLRVDPATLLEIAQQFFEFIKDVIIDNVIQIIQTLTGIDLSGIIEFLDQIAENLGFLGGFGDLFGFFEFIPQLFGGFDLLNLASLNPIDIITQFVTTMINPLGFFANLIGGFIPGLQIPGLDASKIISGFFPMTMIDGLLDALSDLPVIGPLIEALTGIIDGDLGDVTSWAGNLLNIFSFLDARNLFGLLRPGQIPLIGLGQIGQTSPNLLISPQFENASTVEGETFWTWDGSVGRTAMGSAKTTAAGVLRELVSNPIAVTEGQGLSFEVWTRWAGLAFVGVPIRLSVAAYNNNVLQETVDLDAPPAPNTNQLSWVQLDGSYTVPDNVDEVRMRLSVSAGTSTGDVWFDDAVSRKPATTMPQSWIGGLVEDISEIFGNFLGIFNIFGGGGLGDLGNFVTNLLSLFDIGNVLDLSGSPGGFNPLTILSGFVTNLLNPMDLLEDTLARFDILGIFNIFGGSGGGLTQIGNFVENLLSLFDIGSITGLLGSPGSFNPLTILTDFVTNLLNPLNLLEDFGARGDLLGIFDIFGGSGGGLTQIGNFVENLLSLFDIGSITGLLGSPGSFNPTSILTAFVTNLLNPLGILQDVFARSGFSSLLGIFGGSGGGLTQVGNFVQNILSLFDIGGVFNTAGGIAGAPGLFDVDNFLTDWIQNLINPLNLLTSATDFFGLLGVFGGAGNTGQAGNFFTNLLSLFANPTGLLTNPGSFNPLASGFELIDTFVPGIGSILDNLFGGITGIFGGAGRTHSDMTEVVTSQAGTVVTTSSSVAQLLAALGPGTPDADDFERVNSTLGTLWNQYHSGSGTLGTPNGHDATFGGSADDEWVAYRNAKFALADNQSVSMVFSSSPTTEPIFIPTQFGANDIWIRMSNFTTFATRTGVRLRYNSSGKKLRLSSFNNGTETLMTEATVTAPVTGTTMSLESGIGGNPRKFRATLGNTRYEWTEVGTASLYGELYRRRGFGGRQMNLIVTGRPGGLKQWTAQG